MKSFDRDSDETSLVKKIILQREAAKLPKADCLSVSTIQGETIETVRHKFFNSGLLAYLEDSNQFIH